MCLLGYLEQVDNKFVDTFKILGYYLAFLSERY